MPDDAGRDAAFYDHENEPRRHVADWGGDDLFTRMPRRRAVHTPPPRHRRPAPTDPIHRQLADSPGRFERTDPDPDDLGSRWPSGGRFGRGSWDDDLSPDWPSGRRFSRGSSDRDDFSAD